MLTGQNGILTRSSEASEQSAVAGAKEKVTLAVNEAITDYYKDAYGAASSTKADMYTKVSTAVKALNNDEENGATITATESGETAGEKQFLFL